MSENSQLSLHTGGQAVTYDQLSLFKPPEPTKTYAPMSHQELIQLVMSKAEDSLTGYKLKDQSIGVAPKSGENIGDKMFGVLTYEHPDHPELGLSIGFRNSYDQSLAVGVCMGAQVFVCDNLCFSGEIRVTRKHTGDVRTDVENLLESAIYQAPSKHIQIANDMEFMKSVEITDDEAWAILGMGYGREILKPRQLLVARNSWVKPPQDDFSDRTLWSLYNAFTEALKSSTARDVMENHVASHELIMGDGMTLLGVNLPGVELLV
tara:strand:+ start:15022 stop:15813 length:792 start_codon:yes stop_codon:yes gene_type:complete